MRLTATYEVPLYTPILSDALGGTVDLFAQTVAPIYES